MTETTIGVLGAVDNGKSSSLSCLAFDILDDGRGSARERVFQHPHERETGRTSSVSKIHMHTNDKNFVSFIDLAGHEKYLHITFHGILGNELNYAMLIIGSNMGITKMSREHLSVAISLKIPLFIVCTKTDLAPTNILEQTIEDIKKLISKTRRYPLGIELIKDIDKANQILDLYKKREFYNICPVFQTSNKTGENLDLLKYFIHSLPQIQQELQIPIDINNTKKICRIHSKYMVRGIGVVVSCLMVEGIINKGDVLFIGQIYGQWHRITIKSIHDNFRTEISSLSQGQTGCLALSFNDRKLKIDKYKMGKGIIIGDQPYKLTRNFKARVAITMAHSTTISVGYQPIIYCKTVIQAAKVCAIDKGVIRCGDQAEIDFAFLFHSEYVNAGDIFIFSEGSLRGIGKITELLPDNLTLTQSNPKTTSRKARRMARLQAIKERVEQDLLQVQQIQPNNIPVLPPMISSE